MGMVTNVYWQCPGCGSREQAQAYRGYGDPQEVPVGAVPASRGLKWNPPCSVCGEYRLILPEVLVQCVPVRCTGEDYES